MNAVQASLRCYADGKSSSPAITPNATAAFFVGILRQGRRIGAIAPTSSVLARSMSEAADVPNARNIIELGAGTGAVTAEIMRAKSPSARVLALEQNAAFATLLSRRFPGVYVRRTCASKVDLEARAVCMPEADCILSSLPWTELSPEVQRAVFAGMSRALRADGVFTTIACYGPHLTRAGRSFRSSLNEIFAEVRTTRLTWRNIPPAFVYQCRGLARVDTPES